MFHPEWFGTTGCRRGVSMGRLLARYRRGAGAGQEAYIPGRRMTRRRFVRRRVGATMGRRGTDREFLRVCARVLFCVSEREGSSAGVPSPIPAAGRLSKRNPGVRCSPIRAPAWKSPGQLGAGGSFRASPSAEMRALRHRSSSEPVGPSWFLRTTQQNRSRCSQTRAESNARASLHMVVN